MKPLFDFYENNKLNSPDKHSIAYSNNNTDLNEKSKFFNKKIKNIQSRLCKIDKAETKRKVFKLSLFSKKQTEKESINNEKDNKIKYNTLKNNTFNISNIYNKNNENILMLDYYDKFSIFPGENLTNLTDDKLIYRNLSSIEKYKSMRESIINKNRQSIIGAYNNTNILEEDKRIGKFLEKNHKKSLTFNNFQQYNIKKNNNKILLNNEMKEYTIKLINRFNFIDENSHVKNKSINREVVYYNKMENQYTENFHQGKIKQLKDEIHEKSTKLNSITLKINDISNHSHEIKSEIQAEEYKLSLLKEEENLLNMAGFTDETKFNEKKKNKTNKKLKKPIENEENEIETRQNLVKRLNKHEDDIKILTKDLYINDYMKESLKFDYEKTEKEINKLKEEYKKEKDLLCIHYHKILYEGVDTRDKGLVWIIKSIWLLEKEVFLSYIPKILDMKMVEYIFKVSHLEIELYNSNELIKDVKKLIVYNRGVSQRIESKVLNFNNDEVRIRQKELLNKIYSIEKYYDNNSQYKYDLINEKEEFSYKNNEFINKNMSNLGNLLSNDKNIRHIKRELRKKTMEMPYNITIKSMNEYMKRNKEKEKMSNTIDTNYNTDIKTNTGSVFSLNKEKHKNKDSIYNSYSNIIKKELFQIEEHIKPKLENITKENIINYLYSNDFLDDNSKYFLDFVSKLEEINKKIKNELTAMRTIELNRILKEFMTNDYEKKYGVSFNSILSIMIGEDNIKDYSHVIENMNKEYISKYNMIRHFSF